MVSIYVVEAHNLSGYDNVIIIMAKVVIVVEAHNLSGHDNLVECNG